MMPFVISGIIMFFMSAALFVLSWKISVKELGRFDLREWWLTKYTFLAFVVAILGFVLITL